MKTQLPPAEDIGLSWDFFSRECSPWGFWERASRGQNGVLNPPELELEKFVASTDLVPLKEQLDVLSFRQRHFSSLRKDFSFYIFII